MSLNQRKNSNLTLNFNKKNPSMMKMRNINDSCDVIYANNAYCDDDDILNNIPLSVLEINEKNERAARTSTFYINENPKYHSPQPGTTNDLVIGSLVEVLNDISEKPLYGVVRWMGVESGSNFVIVGVELEEEQSHLPLTLTDGIHKGERYFQCAENRGLFVPLEQCSKDSRFQDGSPTPVRHNSNYEQMVSFVIPLYLVLTCI